MAQTIGRLSDLISAMPLVLRAVIFLLALGLLSQNPGYVSVPVHSNHGAAVIKRLQRVTDEIFVKGVCYCPRVTVDKVHISVVTIFLGYIIYITHKAHDKRNSRHLFRIVPKAVNLTTQRVSKMLVVVAQT